ncbi:MAG: ISKra4 family transposase [Syntrophobacteraceae bacterium]|nr:ISKra4 family transposase [Syntrophobacteraceae bacterium]
MNLGFGVATLCEVFNPACELFESLIAELCSEKAAQMEHGQIETLISQIGTELLRRLMQGCLDLRAIREPRRHDVGVPDGPPLTHCRTNCRRDLATVFGEVTAKRKGYSSPGVASRFPLDAELNLGRDKYSHGLRRRVAEEVALHSFDEAVSNTRKYTGGNVPKRQTQEMVVSAAQDFEAFYTQRETDGPEQTSDLLVMSTDQKGIVMRKEDLRPATRKAAEHAVQRPGARLNPGEKRNRKRMATVATVYTLEAQKRSPEMIMGLCPEQERSARPQARNKRVWASVEQEPQEVIQAMFDEALRRDPDKKRPWVVLLDGAEKQLDLVLTLIHRHRPDVTIVLDFIHVLEYVWRAAYSFYAVGSKEAEDWVAGWALKILQGQACTAAIGLRQSATLHQLSSDKRKAVDKCADYLEKYQALLDYDEYLSKGLPIATGVIEGACRHLIKDRMDLTGARWRLKTAEAVLRIRSLRSSGDIESYWDFHQARERKRNYPCNQDFACAA